VNVFYWRNANKDSRGRAGAWRNDTVPNSNGRSEQRGWIDEPSFADIGYQPKTTEAKLAVHFKQPVAEVTATGVRTSQMV
jgi:hypothetical protein